MDASPLRQRDVRLVVGAVGISALGDFLLWIPLTLHLQEMSGSGLAIAGLFLALWTPVVVLAPVAGLVVDKFEARGVLLAASLAQPAEFALVPVVARGERLTEVNGLVETARYAGMTAGPLLGGVLAGFGGTDVAMLVNAGTFGVVAAAALVLHGRRHPQAAPEGAEHERARDGIAYLFRDRTLAIAMSVLFATLLFMTASVTAEVFFLKEDLEVSDAVYGVVFGAWTVGMVVGALVVARKVPPHALALGLLVATLVQGIGLGLPTAWLVAAFGGAMWFVGGIGHGTKNTLARTLIQERVPSRLHGRAFAAYNAMRNGAELVALACGGLLVTAIGGRTTLALAGGISVAVALVGLALTAVRDENPQILAPPPQKG
jgi:MFS family permease